MSENDAINFYEAYKRRGDPDWYWKVYHFDVTGEREIITHRAKQGFATPEAAYDAAAEYCDENDIFAEFSEPAR